MTRWKHLDRDYLGTGDVEDGDERGVERVGGEMKYCVKIGNKF
jgi:hypothetical protein